MVDTRTLPQRILFLFSNGSVALLGVVALPSLIAKRSIRRFAWIWIIVVIALSIVANLSIGIVTSYRYVFAAWPALALVVGIGLDRLTNNTAGKNRLLAVLSLAG